MKKLQRLFQHEAVGGVLLMLATLLALLFANSFVSPWYEGFLHMPVEVRVGALHLDKSLYHWVNDGLMAIFFLYLGLEVKREMLEGHLSSLRQVMLPSIAAVGGMVVPACVYLWFNHGDISASNGWAIPTATDVAFALGVLSLLGKRVPVSLKVFLMALAVVDDMGAVMVIALFYSVDLSLLAIAGAAVCLFVLIVMNMLGVSKKSAYMVVGVVLWLSVLESGVHATLAGIVLAFTIPLYANDEHQVRFSPLRDIEHALVFWVTFIILPLFAFVNAGVDLGGISLIQMTAGVPLGIILGLFLGKQLGVFGFSWLAIKLGLADMPKGASWRQIYGVSILTGIGFTMSLFIVSLAFEADDMFQYTDKLAILVGSLLSGSIGYLVLRYRKK